MFASLPTPTAVFVPTAGSAVGSATYVEFDHVDAFLHYGSDGTLYLLDYGKRIA